MADLYDVITIGSVTRDVFLHSHDFSVKRDKNSETGKSIFFPLGSKVALDEIHFETGGSALNAAATFAAQGFHAGVLAKIGDDFRGEAVMERLTELGADFLLSPDAEGHTAYSLVLNVEGGERTILVYRGASENLSEKDIPWSAIKSARWWYIGHLGGASAKELPSLLKFAEENGISVALNPGHTQIAEKETFLPLLKTVKVLLLNEEEAAELTGIAYGETESIFKKLDQYMQGIVVMTKGPKGVSVSDGKTRWDAAILKEPAYVDRTGAGDAFGSGFVVALMRAQTIEEAIQLGSANATSVLGQWGANRGLLTEEDDMYKFGKLKITISKP